tara:strand:- start:236 stop:412 length:177 start_codon:yes stop_codon:yes gene_type:complete
MKRLMIDVFVEDEDYSSLSSAINAIKLKKKNFGNEKASMKIHDCGHEQGKPCKNEVNL